MTRVLAYTSPARGHLYPIVPILQELRRRGDEIALCTLASEVELMHSLGFEAREVSERVEEIELDDYKWRSPHARGIRALATFIARAEHEAPDLVRAIADHEPDVLLLDVNCWGAAIVAEASGLPWAIYSPYLLLVSSRNAPPSGLGLPPARGPLGAARDAIARRLAAAVLTRLVLPALDSLRAANGLAPLKSFDDLFRRAPLLLALTAEGFEYPRSDWPANVRLVGAVNWDPPAAPLPAAAPISCRSSCSSHAPFPSTPKWLAEMRDPLVLVTCSTEYQNDGRLIGVALEALPAAGMSVLATTGAHNPGEFQAPAGSTVTAFVSHEAVLRRAACVVCHGGMGITQKALAAGVPVVVVPFGRDQLETARRVEFAEAGVRLMPRRLTPERLRACVRAAMLRRAGARRVSHVYAQAGGAMAAADAIGALE